MANKKIPAWGNRRWKLFEKEYADNGVFKTKIDAFAKEEWSLKRVGRLMNVLLGCNLPDDLIHAVEEFISRPDLDRRHYIQLIPPPAQFWSTAQNKTGPTDKTEEYDDKIIEMLTDFGISSPKLIRPVTVSTAKAYLDLVLRSGGIEVTVNGEKIGGLELGRILSGGDLMLRINPYTTKTELKQFIDECWNELEPLINTNGGEAPNSEKLLGNIRRSKHDDETKREQLIVKLTKAGESDSYIQGQLHKYNFGYITIENIRQIRFRFNRKNKG